jgi:hypothetical protein
MRKRSLVSERCVSAFGKVSLIMRRRFLSRGRRPPVTGERIPWRGRRRTAMGRRVPVMRRRRSNSGHGFPEGTRRKLKAVLGLRSASPRPLRARVVRPATRGSQRNRAGRNSLGWYLLALIVDLRLKGRVHAIRIPLREVLRHGERLRRIVARLAENHRDLERLPVRVRRQVSAAEQDDASEIERESLAASA